MNKYVLMVWHVVEMQWRNAGIGMYNQHEEKMKTCQPVKRLIKFVNNQKYIPVHMALLFMLCLVSSCAIAHLSDILFAILLLFLVFIILFISCVFDWHGLCHVFIRRI